VGTLFCSLILSWLTDPNFSLRFTWPNCDGSVALALLNYVLGRLLITAALLHLRAVETSAFLPLQPVLTVLWAFLIFGERRSAPPGRSARARRRGRVQSG
jgi:drug/metabolite transporter (DMT)-like permease